MRNSWTVAWVVASICVLTPIQTRAQALRELGISSSDIVRPEPQKYSTPSTEQSSTEPKADVEVEGPVPTSPPSPQKRKALLVTFAVIGFAGLGLEVGAVLGVVVAFVAKTWSSTSLSITCDTTSMDDDGIEHSVENPCSEERVAIDNEFEQRAGVAGRLAIAGGATLGAAGILALSTMLATRKTQQPSSAKASAGLASQLRPTLGLDSNGFQVGLRLAF